MYIGLISFIFRQYKDKIYPLKLSTDVCGKVTAEVSGLTGLAERAVDIFNEILEEQDNVGVAWGRTCYEFMSQYYSDNNFLSIDVVPLIGGSNRQMKRYLLNEMVRDFAQKLNATPHFLHSPAFSSS